MSKLHEDIQLAMEYVASVIQPKHPHLRFLFAIMPMEAKTIAELTQEEMLTLERRATAAYSKAAADYIKEVLSGRTSTRQH